MYKIVLINLEKENKPEPAKNTIMGGFNMSNMSPTLTHRGKNVTARKMVKRILGNWQLYLFLLPTLAYFLIFRYYPMYGLQIAFRNYKAVKGIWGSPWVGFQNFKRFLLQPISHSC